MVETIRQRARRVFMEVADLAADVRGAALQEATAGDDQLRAEVQALLDAEARAGAFMATPTADGPGTLSDAPTLAATPRESPGTRTGPYKLLELIGEGGFGSVFMAEQEKPVSRRVALKIIKPGMDTRAVIARFEAERQALAMMDHPNIARVLDAGETETGRPYFVMELCKGEPIAEYCDKKNLSIRDRLEVFAQVCAAVQHAHTKGIIHRDLKPSNVLVSTQDGRPFAKVIDFGIAKATAGKLTEKTLFTEHWALIGTPEYMSPEQAEGSLDIDTRTDVYSLGVLLYELLTGTTPFSSRELRSAACAEIQRIIREVEPPKPSTRLSANTDTIASVAARRHTEPKRLGSIVRGELDWIVMKALEKDRRRRYETADGLAMDIHRYMSGEAVVAASPSGAYRFKKFIRRNKGPVFAGSAVAAALLVGVVAFAWQAEVARAQRDIAVQARMGEAAQRKLAEEQRQWADAARAEAQAQQARAEEQEAEAKKREAEAREQAAIAEAVAKCQTDMLAAIDPANLPRDPVTGEPLKDTVTVAQAMEAAIKVLDEGSLVDQPLVEAGVRGTIGRTLIGLGRYAQAEPILRKSLALRREFLATGHPDIAVGLNSLGHGLMFQNKIAEAESLFREALAIRRASLPAGHPDISTSLNNLAELLRSQRKLDEAETLYRQAVAIDRASLPAGHPDIATGLTNLAACLQEQNKLADAEAIHREAVAIYRAALPANHPRTAIGLGHLAELLRLQGSFAEAESLHREALEIYRVALPAGHPSIAAALNNVAMVLAAQNNQVEAEPLYREALEIQRASLPAGHPNIASSLTNISHVLFAQSRFAEAEPLLREALEIRRASLSAGHPQITISVTNLAGVQQALGKNAEARAGWDEAIARMRQESPDGSANFARVLWRSGLARLDDGNAAAALPELERAVAVAEKFLAPDHPHLKQYREAMARCREAQGK